MSGCYGFGKGMKNHLTLKLIAERVEKIEKEYCDPFKYSRAKAKVIKEVMLKASLEAKDWEQMKLDLAILTQFHDSFMADYLKTNGVDDGSGKPKAGQEDFAYCLTATTFVEELSKLLEDAQKQGANSTLNAVTGGGSKPSTPKKSAGPTQSASSKKAASSDNEEVIKNLPMYSTATSEQQGWIRFLIDTHYDLKRAGGTVTWYPKKERLSEATLEKFARDDDNRVFKRVGFQLQPYLQQMRTACIAGKLIVQEELMNETMIAHCRTLAMMFAASKKPYNENDFVAARDAFPLPTLGSESYNDVNSAHAARVNKHIKQSDRLEHKTPRGDRGNERGRERNRDRWDGGWNSGHRQENRPWRGNRRTLTCFNCKGQGHKQEDCPSAPQAPQKAPVAKQEKRPRSKKKAKESRKRARSVDSDTTESVASTSS